MILPFSAKPKLSVCGGIPQLSESMHAFNKLAQGCYRVVWHWRISAEKQLHHRHFRSPKQYGGRNENPLFTLSTRRSNTVMTMKELHDRIGRVINARAFQAALDKAGIALFDFQLNWMKISGSDFSKLPAAYRKSIEAGERELRSDRVLELAA